MTCEAVLPVRRVNDVVNVTPYNLICTNVSEKSGASCVKLENRDRLRQNIGDVDVMYT